MNCRFRHFLASLALVLSFPAVAHEFWMLPGHFAPAPGTPVRLTLHVGEHFEGDPIPFTTAYVAGLSQYSNGKVRNLLRTVPAQETGAGLQFVPEAPGTHLIAYDSHPNQIALSGDKFHAYLHEEGLDAVVKQREAEGTASTPGRERYRRHVKTLLKVGGKSDSTFAQRTGQQLEIVPLADPLVKRAGDTLNFRLLFDDKPLHNILVKAWHKQEGQTHIVRARTDAEGKVAVSLPYAGTWMVSAVHMLAASNVPDIDWESFWGNLTFELPVTKKKF